jgi:hypothetical protein
MCFSGFAKLATTLVLATVGCVASADAQSNKPIRSGTWYEDQALNNVSSSAATSFLLTFAQTPTDKFLNVTNVSCLVQINPELALRTLTLFVGTTSGATDLGRGYNIRPNGPGDTVGLVKVYSVVTGEVFFKMGAGRYPSIIANSEVVSGSATPHVILGCTIVGNLTDN